MYLPEMFLSEEGGWGLCGKLNELALFSREKTKAQFEINAFYNDVFMRIPFAGTISKDCE